MLVLVSFGLVLLATILLVVGLLSDDGLTLIYLSIAASATAAVVLYVAFRRARSKGESTTTSDGPAPLAEDLMPEPPAEEPTAVVPATAPVTEVEPAPQPAPEPAPEPEPVPAAADDDWMADADWEGGEVDFPIADYDDLTVAEIMPLLPQLYSDELDDVIERERDGKNRSTIIDRLEELKVIGTDADAEEFAAGAPAPQETAAADPQDPEPAPVAASPSRSAGASLLDLGDEDDDEYLFPIADYDDLSVAQIVPLLPQLEADELEEVRAREVSGADRKTLLTEIDALLPGGTPDVEPEPPAPAPAKTAPAKKAPAKKKATKKTTKKSSKKRATKKKAAKKKASRFPIANYDELNVADIRPRLTELSDSQLEQVRERERSGAGRKTILNEIDKKLN